MECKAKFPSDGLFDGRVDGKSDEHLMQILMQILMEELMKELMEELMGELTGSLLQIKTCPNRTCMLIQGSQGGSAKSRDSKSEVLAGASHPIKYQNTMSGNRTARVLYQHFLPAIHLPPVYQLEQLIFFSLLERLRLQQDRAYQPR